MSLTWRDNATNETGFSIQRCAGAGHCTNFVQIAVAPPKTNTGNTTYIDTTVACGTTYFYQVVAVNGTGPSAPSNTRDGGWCPRFRPRRPASLSRLRAKRQQLHGDAEVDVGRRGAPNPTNFTIQRATNLGFTTGLTTITAAGSVRTVTQTVTRNTTYYYRIRANNNIGGSSAWTNALPFPIRTGP